MNWSDITLKNYQDLMFFLSTREKMTDLDRNLEIYRILTGEDISNLELDRIKDKLDELSFLNKTYEARVPNTEYVIDGKKYTVQLNLNKMTAGQYIDFQNLYKDYNKNLKYLVMCFLIPKGKKYAEDYDVLELGDYLYDKIPITIVSDVMFFFAKQLEVLTKITLTSSIKMMKKQIKKEKDPEKKQTLQKVLDSLQNEALLYGLTKWAK